MQELKLLVPTYYGATEGKPAFASKKEFDEPNVPVLVCEAEGVRIVLGSHDFMDMDKPDIQIERRPNGWAIFLHPEPGGDASGFVYFLDDGRSFLVPEKHASNRIAVLEHGEEVPLIDEPPLAQLTQDRFVHCPKLASAWVQAQFALRSDSNDAEHDALLALVEAIEEVEVKLRESDRSDDVTPQVVVLETETAE